MIGVDMQRRGRSGQVSNLGSGAAVDGFSFRVDNSVLSGETPLQWAEASPLEHLQYGLGNSPVNKGSVLHA